MQLTKPLIKVQSKHKLDRSMANETTEEAFARLGWEDITWKMGDDSFQGWFSRPKLKDVRNIIWVGARWAVPDGYVATERPTPGYHCDAIVVCCQDQLCYRFLRDHLFPYINDPNCFVLWCWSGHPREASTCIFRRVKMNVGITPGSKEVVHDPITESCFPALVLVKKAS
jgi:hypothetical protein